MKALVGWGVGVAVASASALFFFEGTPQATERQPPKGESKLERDKPDSNTIDRALRVLAGLEGRVADLENTESRGIRAVVEEPEGGEHADAEELEMAQTPEEARRVALAVRAESVRNHDAEGRDPAWARAMESRVSPSLSEQLADSGVKLTGVDCRTTSCIVEVEGRYDEVTSELPEALMKAVPSDCGFFWHLPEPGEDEDAENYGGMASLDCTEMRVK